MISEKYRCIFVHIPKAAGQSIEHFFLNLHELSWQERSPLLLKFNSDQEKGPERLAHLFAHEYISCGHIEAEKFKQYFKFAFVRNPWARLVSEFNYRDYHKEMSFKEFVTNGLPTQSLYHDRYRHIIPQYDFLHDEFGNLLVDFVGKFEKLQQDFDCICDKLNISESKLQHINSSGKYVSKTERLKKLLNFQRQHKKKHYTEYYDDKTLSIVNKMYEKDISTFEYVYGE